MCYFSSTSYESMTTRNLYGNPHWNAGQAEGAQSYQFLFDNSQQKRDEEAEYENEMANYDEEENDANEEMDQTADDQKEAELESGLGATGAFAPLLHSGIHSFLERYKKTDPTKSTASRLGESIMGHFLGEKNAATLQDAFGMAKRTHDFLQTAVKSPQNLAKAIVDKHLSKVPPEVREMVHTGLESAMRGKAQGESEATFRQRMSQVRDNVTDRILDKAGLSEHKDIIKSSLNGEKSPEEMKALIGSAVEAKARQLYPDEVQKIESMRAEVRNGISGSTHELYAEVSKRSSQAMMDKGADMLVRGGGDDLKNAVRTFKNGDRTDEYFQNLMSQADQQESWQRGRTGNIRDFQANLSRDPQGLFQGAVHEAADNYQRFMNDPNAINDDGFMTKLRSNVQKMSTMSNGDFDEHTKMTASHLGTLQDTMYDRMADIKSRRNFGAIGDAEMGEQMSSLRDSVKVPFLASLAMSQSPELASNPTISKGVGYMVGGTQLKAKADSFASYAKTGLTAEEKYGKLQSLADKSTKDVMNRINTLPENHSLSGDALTHYQELNQRMQSRNLTDADMTSLRQQAYTKASELGDIGGVKKAFFQDRQMLLGQESDKLSRAMATRHSGAYNDALNSARESYASRADEMYDPEKQAWTSLLDFHDTAAKLHNKASLTNDDLMDMANKTYNIAEQSNSGLHPAVKGALHDMFGEGGSNFQDMLSSHIQQQETKRILQNAGLGDAHADMLSHAANGTMPNWENMTDDHVNAATDMLTQGMDPALGSTVKKAVQLAHARNAPSGSIDVGQARDSLLSDLTQHYGGKTGNFAGKDEMMSGMHKFMKGDDPIDASNDLFRGTTKLVMQQNPDAAEAVTHLSTLHKLMTSPSKKPTMEDATSFLHDFTQGAVKGATGMEMHPDISARDMASVGGHASIANPTPSDVDGGTTPPLFKFSPSGSYKPGAGGGGKYAPGQEQVVFHGEEPPMDPKLQEYAEHLEKIYGEPKRPPSKPSQTDGLPSVVEPDTHGYGTEQAEFSRVLRESAARDAARRQSDLDTLNALNPRRYEYNDVPTPLSSYSAPKGAPSERLVPKKNFASSMPPEGKRTREPYFDEYGHMSTDFDPDYGIFTPKDGKYQSKTMKYTVEDGKVTNQEARVGFFEGIGNKGKQVANNISERITQAAKKPAPPEPMSEPISDTFSTYKPPPSHPPPSYESATNSSKRAKLDTSHGQSFPEDDPEVPDDQLHTPMAVDHTPSIPKKVTINTADPRQTTSSSIPMPGMVEQEAPPPPKVNLKKSSHPINDLMSDAGAKGHEGLQETSAAPPPPVTPIRPESNGGGDGEGGSAPQEKTDPLQSATKQAGSISQTEESDASAAAAQSGQAKAMNQTIQQNNQKAQQQSITTAKDQNAEKGIATDEEGKPLEGAATDTAEDAAKTASKVSEGVELGSDAATTAAGAVDPVMAAVGIAGLATSIYSMVHKPSTPVHQQGVQPVKPVTQQNLGTSVNSSAVTNASSGANSVTANIQ